MDRDLRVGSYLFMICYCT